MGKEGAGRQTVGDAGATCKRVRDRNGMRRTRRRGDTGATKGPTQHFRKSGRRERRMRRCHRKPEVVQNVHGAPQNKVFQCGNRTEGDVVGKRWKPPDDDGQAHMSLTISLAKAGRQKPHAVVVDNEKQRTHAQRPPLKGDGMKPLQEERQASFEMQESPTEEAPPQRWQKPKRHPNNGRDAVAGDVA